jgi:hypothetical protein
MYAGKDIVTRACRVAGILLLESSYYFYKPYTLVKAIDRFPKVVNKVASKPLDFVRVDV